MKKYLSLIFLFTIFCMVAACGKISNPEAVPNSGYPHTYPYR